MQMLQDVKLLCDPLREFILVLWDASPTSQFPDKAKDKDVLVNLLPKLNWSLRVTRCDQADFR